MHISEDDTSKTKGISQIRAIIIFFYFFLIIFFEILMASKLQDEGDDFLEHVQENWSKELINVIIYFSYLGTLIPFVIVIIFVYNFTNIFKSYVLLMIFFLSYLCSGVLKLILKQKRPFFDKEGIAPIIFCSLGYGNPAGHTLMATAIYLTTWHIFYANSYIKGGTFMKYFTLCLTLVVILLVFFGTFFAALNSLNQLIFGLLLGVGIYLTIFYVLNIDLNNGHQFSKFLLVNNFKYIAVNFSITALVFMLFYLLPPSSKISEWDEHINKLDNCKSISPTNRYDNESFMLFPVFIANIFAYLGIKCEFHLTFKSVVQDWNKYNFEKIEKLDDSMLSKISDDIQVQWNHTSKSINIIRLFVVICMSLIILLPYILISWENDLYILFFFKFFIPVSLVCFSLFFLFKLVLKKLKLINQELFNLLDDFTNTKEMIRSS